ncbi:MAG: hypothetical protein KGJ41_04525 [Rhodospirillales bacterium]|nr:hypothetical protein [Rhodospirillales bacterium]
MPSPTPRALLDLREQAAWWGLRAAWAMTALLAAWPAAPAAPGVIGAAVASLAWRADRPARLARHLLALTLMDEAVLLGRCAPGGALPLGLLVLAGLTAFADRAVLLSALLPAALALPALPTLALLAQAGVSALLIRELRHLAASAGGGRGHRPAITLRVLRAR